VFIIVIMFLL